MYFYDTFSTTVYSQLAASAQPANPFPPTHLSFPLPTHPSPSLPIHSPTYLPIHPFILPPIYLYIYLSLIYLLTTSLPMDPIFYPFLKPPSLPFLKISQVSASFSAPTKAKVVWCPSLCVLSSLVSPYCLLLRVPRSLGMITARCPSHAHQRQLTLSPSVQVTASRLPLSGHLRSCL